MQAHNGVPQRRQNLVFVETGSLGIKTHKACAQTLTLPLSSCVTSGGLLNLSVPDSLSFKWEQHPQQRVAQRLNEFLYVKYISPSQVQQNPLSLPGHGDT